MSRLRTYNHLQNGYEPMRDTVRNQEIERSETQSSFGGQISVRSGFHHYLDRMPQSTSYQLSGRDLKDLYKPRGHMPQILFSQPNLTGMEASRRVSQLDAALQARVQQICDRLRFAKDKSISARCGRFSRVWLRHLTPGVLSEIFPTILFFVAYSLLVTWYAEQQDWEVIWSAKSQDAIYYPAVVLSFLLCFRASGCMDRYNEGLKRVFNMERCLREVAFEVMTRLSVADDPDGGVATPEAQAAAMMRELRKKYFKHEFRRTIRLLFTCAARDLNDSALEDSEFDENGAAELTCAMTKVEHAAVLVTHSAFGHAFRVYLVCQWLLKLVKAVDEDKLFDTDGSPVTRTVEEKITEFKHAWLAARQVAYSSMPGSVTHTLWLLTTAMCLFMPWEWVSVCQWSTWFPSVLLTVSFYGILHIANTLENPFGFDGEDIPIAQVGEHLDEEVCLTMHYAALDECGGENLYRSLMGSTMIFLDERDRLNSEIDLSAAGGSNCCAC